jgi:hypothetical protein
LRPAGFCSVSNSVACVNPALFQVSSHSFSPAAFGEKSVIGNRPTKEFCEIAVILVSAPYCGKLMRVPLLEFANGTWLTALFNQL